MRKIIATGLTGLALSGCVAVWGSAYHIEQQSQDSVVLKYDSNFIDRNDVVTIANKGCDAYGRKAVAENEDTSAVNITTITFKCEKRQ